jgi:hypothetical protein
METLSKLAQVLRRTDCCSRLRALRDDVSNALASERATDAEILEMIQRAQALKVWRGGEAIL